MNIGIDTFALIDDSPFERAEVNDALPQVRAYSEKEICRLLAKPEFDVPVTEASKSRRTSYLIQLQREHVQEQYGEDITAFLKNCRMKMEIFVPVTPDHINRCLELIQRSNQLNLSSKKYNSEQFMSLLKNPDFLCIAFHCSDRFGDYGIVGFSSINEASAAPRLMDLVISCRVAQKRVEHALIEWLVSRQRNRGCTVLHAELIKTKKNGPLQNVFSDLPFTRTDETNDLIAFSLKIDTPIVCNQVIEITDNTNLLTMN